MRPPPPDTKPSQPRRASSAALACACGFLSVCIPWLITGARKNMIDGMRLESLHFMLLSGFLLGRARPKHAWIIGLATMAAFPVIALVEVILDPTTHNLLPLECIGYGLMTFPGLFGALCGRAVRRRNDRLGL